MRTTALLLMLLIAGMTAQSDTVSVYICTGSSSVCYHRTPDCKGLDKCGGKIKAITLEEAQNLGRRPCKICYGY